MTTQLKKFYLCLLSNIRVKIRDLPKKYRNLKEIQRLVDQYVEIQNKLDKLNNI